MKRYHLVLARVLDRTVQPRDLVAVAERVERRAPEIEVAVAGRRRSDQWKLLPHAFRPTLTVAFGALRCRRFLSGRILHCAGLHKHAELEQLRAAGIPVPDWVLIEPGVRLDPAVWGPTSSSNRARADGEPMSGSARPGGSATNPRNPSRPGI